ncbi:hypothetical protein WJX74_003835 [Apatococcus lobatus]|uniref:F-box domain-containing protein n=1 Tax=Apatococcus lobatus TaxID=904363 RepID=A0AAW1RHC0_9CHLO
MQHRNGAGGWPLPLELTKLILAPLNLRDRLALASACRFLRTACDPPDCWRTCKLDSLAEFAEERTRVSPLLRALGQRASAISELQGHSSMKAVWDCWQQVWAMLPRLQTLIWSVHSDPSSSAAIAHLYAAQADSRAWLVHSGLSRIDLTVHASSRDIKWMLEMFVQPHADAVISLDIKCTGRDFPRLPDFALENLKSISIRAKGMYGQLSACNLQSLTVYISENFFWHTFQQCTRLQALAVSTQGDIKFLEIPEQNTGYQAAGPATLRSVHDLKLIGRTICDSHALLGVVSSDLQRVILQVSNPSGSSFDVGHLLGVPSLAYKLQSSPGGFCLEMTRR